MSPTPAWPRATSALRLAHPTIGGAVTVELWHCHRRGTGYFLGHVSLEIDPTKANARIWLRRPKRHADLLTAVETDPVVSDGVAYGLLLRHDRIKPVDLF